MTPKLCEMAEMRGECKTFLNGISAVPEIILWAEGWTASLFSRGLEG